MRYLLAMPVFAAAFLATAALAEKRVFIIANEADGYGIDRCLASGESCGAAAASAYCESKEFTKAASYRKVERSELTGAVPTGGACRGGACMEFVAIECTR